MSQFPIEDALKPECDSIRADLLAIEKRCRRLIKTCAATPEGSVSDAQYDAWNERMDQAILAVRHIEDARMRIGKVLQYARDGVSCFDAAPDAADVLAKARAEQWEAKAKTP